MFADTAKRISYWENRVKELKKEIANCEEDDVDYLIDLKMDLNEAEAQLNYAWQDDELEEMGLR